uniref:Uncharacterized protein n=1 Tax=Solanum tuberosum TaxID=4113 RepID=M1DU49_SOLTU
MDRTTVRAGQTSFTSEAGYKGPRSTDTDHGPWSDLRTVGLFVGRDLADLLEMGLGRGCSGEPWTTSTGRGLTYGPWMATVGCTCNFSKSVFLVCFEYGVLHYISLGTIRP